MACCRERERDRERVGYTVGVSFSFQGNTFSFFPLLSSIPSKGGKKKKWKGKERRERDLRKNMIDMIHIPDEILLKIVT
jgi:hypothetical protein